MRRRQWRQQQLAVHNKIQECKNVAAAGEREGGLLFVRVVYRHHQGVGPGCSRTTLPTIHWNWLSARLVPTPEKTPKGPDGSEKLPGTAYELCVLESKDKIKPNVGLKL